MTFVVEPARTPAASLTRASEDAGARQSRGSEVGLGANARAATAGRPDTRR
jgi:hypothetical protein